MSNESQSFALPLAPPDTVADHLKSAGTPQAPNTPHNIDLESLCLTTSPTRVLISAGEAAMRQIGLSHPTMLSVQLSPWWATCESTPAHQTREYHARNAFIYRSKAQRLMNKAMEYRDQKLKIQSDLVWTRDYRRHEKTGADIKDMKREEFSTRPPSLPWDRDDENNMVAWDDQHWVDRRRPKDLRDWDLEWDDKKDKKHYRKAWKKMARYRARSEMAMTNAYYSALKGLEAPVDHEFWGKYFG